MEALNRKYLSVSSEYEAKMKRLISENEDYVLSLNTRKEFELKVNDKNSER